jgi:hypothetical protein
MSPLPLQHRRPLKPKISLYVFLAIFSHIKNGRDREGRLQLSTLPLSRSLRLAFFSHANLKRRITPPYSFLSGLFLLPRDRGRVLVDELPVFNSHLIAQSPTSLQQAEGGGGGGGRGGGRGGGGEGTRSSPILFSAVASLAASGSFGYVRIKGRRVI